MGRHVSFNVLGRNLSPDRFKPARRLDLASQELPPLGIGQIGNAPRSRRTFKPRQPARRTDAPMLPA